MALNALTGLVFLIGHPEQYVHNIAWWYKVGSLALAGLNAAVFEAGGSARARSQLGAGEDTPLAAKAIGAVSIVAWFGVLFWGRDAAVHRQRLLKQELHTHPPHLPYPPYPPYLPYLPDPPYLPTCPTRPDVRQRSVDEVDRQVPAVLTVRSCAPRTARARS